MNHLAHFCLASAIPGQRPSPELLVGGLLGDFVKGRIDRPRPDLDALSTEVIRGIALHRHIDSLTARDVRITASARRFDPRLRRYAPILLDIVGDHFLARDFERWHDDPLERTIDHVNAALRQHRPSMPESARQLADRFVSHQILEQYLHLDIVRRGFQRIAVRLKADALIPLMSESLDAQYDALRADFGVYYPALQQASAQWLAKARADS